MDAERLKLLLHLEPLTIEGGYFTETYRSPETIAPECLPGPPRGARTFLTCIYYLLEPNTFSELHRLTSDEIFHFYLGDPVEMLQLWPDGSARKILLGTELEAGMAPQVVVPRRVWQGTRLLPGSRYALLGCTVSPGFEYDDYEAGSRAALSRQYPAQAEMITALTRK
jgi:predicted cupin superfamily sugar epimerase